jgi:guanine deaminase
MRKSGFTVLRHGLVLDPASLRAEPRDVLIEGGTIRELAPWGMAVPEGAAPVDARQRLVLPGLVNAHTHAHGGLGKGAVADRAPLEVFLTASGAINGNRTIQEKYLSAKLSAVEMVRKGCTASYDLFVEYPLPSQEGIYAVARAYQDVGMRAAVAPMMADRTLYDAYPGLTESMPEQVQAQVRRLRMAPYAASIQACEAILRGWPFDRERVRPALGPTIPLHCSDDFLRACHTLSRDFGVGLQTHLAETKAQAVMALRRYGRSLTAHLSALGLIDERFSAAHGIWLDTDDIRRLADGGAAIAHNPLSNLRLGSGVAPARLMLDAGLAVGVGTDAANTSDTQNMFEAARLAVYLSRLQGPDPARWLSVEEGWRMATAGSARVLGFQDRIGRIAPGFLADLVLLDLRHITYVPLRNVPLQVLNGESGAAVDSVMVGGDFILRDGRMATVDEDALRREAEAAQERLDRANAESLEAARALEDIVGLFCLAHARAPLPFARRFEAGVPSESAPSHRVGGGTS